MALPTRGFDFTETSRDGHARAGLFTTPRAVVETPAFMPVGTQATVKSLTPDDVAHTGARLCLANTYHLWLRPGAELVAGRGGVQRFMGWPFALLTDSGGYQVFSLSKLRKIDDEGATFRSHIDGSLHVLTPEESMRIQGLLGSDIAMLLDECPPGDADRGTVERAVRRTTLWARRCLSVPTREGQARFGIVQGGVFVDLRLSHLSEIASHPVDGVALGGFSVGEERVQMLDALAQIGPAMPTDRPRYLMGVGTPFDLIEAMGLGIDLFDCVLPTRNARNGQAFTWSGRVNLKQARHREDDSALDARCGCPVCTTFSRAYLRHLFNVGEMLGPRLLSQHNLHFYADLTTQARHAITAARYQAWARQTSERMTVGDEIETPT